MTYLAITDNMPTFFENTEFTRNEVFKGQIVHLQTTKCIAYGDNNKEKYVKQCQKNVYISAVYSIGIWCLDLLLLVSDARF